MPQPRVLIADPSVPLFAAVRKFLDGRAEVQSVQTIDEAVQFVHTRAPDVLIATVSGTFDGELLTIQLRQTHPELCVVLVYPPEEEKAFERATEMNADAFLTGPVKRPAVLNAVRTALKLRELRHRVVELAGRVEALETQPAVKTKGPALNAPDEAFFKKYMLLEVKRSRRYAYPVSLVLVSLDRLDAFLEKDMSPEFQRAAIRSEVLHAISTAVRDIDVSMPFADDRFLLFLPHTPRTGALAVSHRLLARLRKVESFRNGTASLGVSSYDPLLEPKSAVSFGALVRDATAALKRAQEAGGNRVEATAVPDVSTRPKKSRISMG